MDKKNFISLRICLNFFLIFFAFVQISDAKKCSLPVDFEQGSLSMYGEVLLDKSFPKTHKKISNHEFRFASSDSFEGINPFIQKGNVPFLIKNFLYDSMMYRSPAEAFTLYPQIVKISDIDSDRKWVVFEVTEGAYFNDKSPITSDDILFTFNWLKTQGRYNYQLAYRDITAEKIDDKKVKFLIGADNRELVMILGLMPVLSHKNDMKILNNQTSEIPLGAGAYVIDSLDMGKRLSLKKNENYYGVHRPFSCQRFFFDKVRIDFFRSEQAVFENFRAGQSDAFYENDITRLNRAYYFPAIKKGDIVYHKQPHYRPSGLYGFVFNLRRPLWQDKTLRKAIYYSFDFDAFNRHYLYGTEEQIDSLFMGSELAYYKNGYEKKSPLSLERRENLYQAFSMLKDKDYSWKEGKLYTPTGEKVTLNINLVNPKEEKYALYFRDMVKDLGIDVHLQTLDSAVYQKRLNVYDYDMILDMRYVSLSPGVEQENFWGCKGKDLQGTRNYAGICDEEIEAVVKSIASVGNYNELKEKISLLDMKLMEGYYYIPLQSRLSEHIFTKKSILPSPYGIEYFKMNQ